MGSFLDKPETAKNEEDGVFGTGSDAERVLCAAFGNIKAGVSDMQGWRVTMEVGCRDSGSGPALNFYCDRTRTSRAS
jgi:hypothetical protein